MFGSSEGVRESSLRYLRDGRYCSARAGSDGWMKFWQEERRRCLEGYESGGLRVTGAHYFYLNYCRIRRAEDVARRVTRKGSGFPDFWDGDYTYFWVREIAKWGVAMAVGGEEERDRVEGLPEGKRELERERLLMGLGLMVEVDGRYLGGGYNLIVGKSRRKGYSYKNAAIAANNYFHREGSLTILNAYEKRFLTPGGIFSMAQSYISFVNSETAWTMPTDVVNKTDHIRSSYLKSVNGIQMEAGFKSEIQAITCNDNADANRGKDAVDIIIEEAGSFGSPTLLKRLYAASEDCVKAGSLKTGMITVFGTSGNLEKGTADYADMHGRPLAFGFMPFRNVWDEGLRDTECGFFHPVNWNNEGYYDGMGNSDLVGARDAELRERERLLEGGASSIEVQRRMQEKPLTPAEAFSVVNVNLFPVQELKAQLSRVKSRGWQWSKGTAVSFVRDGGKVVAHPIMDGKGKAITSLHGLPDNVVGCPIVYEFPPDNPPRGLYKIGYDPVRQDTGTSLAGIVVYKGVLQGALYHSIIVAEYIGRGESSEDMDAMAEYFADYFNTTIMFENEVVGPKNYFRRIKRLGLLALQPDAVISKHIRKSRVSRVYGCHMNEALKNAGERYVKDWLNEVLDYDEDGNPVRALERIYSERLLEELISYHRGGNYDLVSALFMCMFQVQEELEGKVYGDVEDERGKKFRKLLQGMHRDRSGPWRT